MIKSALQILCRCFILHMLVVLAQILFILRCGIVCVCVCVKRNLSSSIFRFVTAVNVSGKRFFILSCFCSPFYYYFFALCLPLAHFNLSIFFPSTCHIFPNLCSSLVLYSAFFLTLLCAVGEIFIELFSLCKKLL